MKFGGDVAGYESERDRILRELKEGIKEVTGDRPVRIILYGSMARGDYGNESDIDVAVIVPGLSRELKNRILDTVADIEFKHLMPVSTIVFSEDDFNHLKRRERRIALDIEKEGILI